MLQRPKISKRHHLSAKEKKLYAAQDINEGPIMLVRVHDWQSRWVQFIQESIQEKLTCDWEFNHCASWSALGVDELTGYDFFAPWREWEIKSPADAYLTLRRMGFNSLDECLASQFVEKPLVFANRGDVVTVPTQEYVAVGMPNACGLADPPYVWVLGTDGLGRVPLLSCTKCYAVGSLG